MSAFWDAEPSGHTQEAPGRRSRARPNGYDHDGETLPFTLFADVEPALDVGDFVEGLLTTSSLAVVYGEPGSGKTFWVLDICLHVAAGLTWQGRAVEQGVVFYLALEGGAGIRNRIAAARQELGLPDSTALVLIQQPVDMCHSDTDQVRIVNTVAAISAQLGLPVRLIVIDTLARAMAGGNENSPEDMGALVATADAVRHATGACVLYIHHSGKDVARGTRGHSSLKGATDTEIEVTRADDGSSIATVTRQRDLDTDGRFAFRLKSVALGDNARGKPVTSCVVEAAEPQPVPPRMAVLTNHEKVALKTLDQALKADGVMATVFAGGTEGSVVAVEDWRQWFYREGLPGAEPDAKRKAFGRVMAGLLAKGRIGTRDDFVWPK